MKKQVKKRRKPKIDQYWEVHEFGTSPLRMKPDYGERRAGREIMFSRVADFFIKRLSEFEYGCYYTDGSSTKNIAVMDEKDGHDIYIQPPSEFWKHKCGMCHDASIFVDAMLEKEGIDHKCYYIYSDRPPHYPTHSFVVALCRDGFKRIIDVFSTKACVYAEKFTSYTEAAEWRLSKWIDDDNGGNKNVHLFQNMHMPGAKYDFVTFAKQAIKSCAEICFSL